MVDPTNYEKTQLVECLTLKCYDIDRSGKQSLMTMPKSGPSRGRYVVFNPAEGGSRQIELEVAVELAKYYNLWQDWKANSRIEELVSPEKVKIGIKFIHAPSTVTVGKDAGFVGKLTYTDGVPSEGISPGSAVNGAKTLLLVEDSTVDKFTTRSSGETHLHWTPGPIYAGRTVSVVLNAPEQELSPKTGSGVSVEKKVRVVK